MTALALPMRSTGLPMAQFAGAFSGGRLFLASGLVVAALIAPTLMAMALDERMLNGVNIWDKPLKFEIALAVYLLTLAFFAQFVPEDWRAKQWYRWHSVATVTAITAELAWIGGAAALGTASHFNIASPLAGAIYGLMGLFAVLLTSASLVQGIAIRANGATGLSPALHRAIWLGLVLTFVLTLPVAGYMSSQAGHLIGGNLSDAEGLALIDWARDGGDLRVAHFFATHAMHFLPIFGLGLSWVGLGRKTWLVDVAAVAFAGFVGFTLVQAIAGLPFLAWLG